MSADGIVVTAPGANVVVDSSDTLTLPAEAEVTLLGATCEIKCPTAGADIFLSVAADEIRNTRTDAISGGPLLLFPGLTVNDIDTFDLSRKEMWYEGAKKD